MMRCAARIRPNLDWRPAFVPDLHKNAGEALRFSVTAGQPGKIPVDSWNGGGHAVL